MTQIGADRDTRDPRTHVVIGAAMEVHRVLGHGFLEAVYHEALAIEFAARDVPFRREIELAVTYKGTPLRCAYKADFVCFDSIVVELKALAALGGVEQAQVLNYLKATGIELGLLLNFGAPRLEFQRLILSSQHLRKSAPSVDQNLSADDAD